MSAPLDEWMEVPPPDAASWLSQVAGRGVLGELALDHAGVAVRDLEEAIERFGTWLGVHDWMRTSFATTSRYRGVEQVIGGNVATVSMGPINLELVQPTQGSWTPVDVLESRGEGLYHLGFRVPDIGAAVQRADDAGLDVALVGLHRDMPIFAYMEPDALFGVCVELVGPRIPNQMITSADQIH